MQARHLASLIGPAHPRTADPKAVALEFDRWCTEWIKPWFDDHLSWDADQVRQWSGEDIDLTSVHPCLKGLNTS